MDVLRYARIEPQALQVELHPYLTQEPLVNLAKLLGIQLTAYSSFGPQVSSMNKRRYGWYTDLRLHLQSYYELGLKDVPSLLSNDAVATVAKKHSRSMFYKLTRTKRLTD